MMQENSYDYYGDSPNTGCCLKCDDAEPDCLCYACNCTKCYWYSYDSYSGGSCDVATDAKIDAEERWQNVIDNMRDIGRELAFCPKCNKNRFMRRFPNDVVCEYWCLACKTAWKKEHFDLFKTDATFKKEIIAMRR